MPHVTRLLCLATLASCLFLAAQNEARAQYPVYYAPVQPVAPAVVGYSARRAGLFGRRVVVNPIVAPVAVGRPVVDAAPVAVARPVVVARPVYAPAPVAVRYAPVSAYYPPPVTTYRVPPVTTYRVPPVTTYRVPPVTTYRVPVRTYVPVYGF